MKKLKNLLEIWPQGTVALSSWLYSLGIDGRLRWVYEKSGWVKSIGHGAVVRSKNKLSWQGGLYALQKELNIPIHIGGKTALEMSGYAHYLRYKTVAVYLYIPTKGYSLPK